MRSRAIVLITAVALAVLAPAAALAIAMAPYTQNFETMSMPGVGLLLGDNWLAYGNVYAPDRTTYLYGYGPYPAPNDGAAFCAIVAGEGGADQGAQQLSVYNDYNNTGAHQAGQFVEANVYQERVVSAADVGQTWYFEFQAKMGNLINDISGTSSAAAFIKTLNPSAGYALTNFIQADMTTIPTTWSGYSLHLYIDRSLIGQIFQFGFMNKATLFRPSGIFYDNVWVHTGNSTAVGGDVASLGLRLGQIYPNPFNPSTRIEFSLEKAGAVDISVYDLAGRRVATLFQGNVEAGEHHVMWYGRASDDSPAAAGQYWCVLKTAAGRVSRAMALVK
jgi:hypothetical protein